MLLRQPFLVHLLELVERIETNSWIYPGTLFPIQAMCLMVHFSGVAQCHAEILVKQRHRYCKVADQCSDN